jgi:hypothetical protein
MMKALLALSTGGCVSLAAMDGAYGGAEPGAPGGTLGADAAFLDAHTDGFVLRRGEAAIYVVPGYQGRVMTATARGMDGPSSGWINYELIRSKRKEAHIHAFGGEERLWIGPEGGQFSIFTAPGKAFTFDDWFTPAAIDTEGFRVEDRAETRAKFSAEFSLRNHSNTAFRVRAEREVRLLDDGEISRLVGMDLPAGVAAVGYRTENALVNRGATAWRKEDGLLCIWMLSMLRCSPTVTVFIPTREGPGAAVNTDYFAKLGDDRLRLRDGVIYFKADGKYRSKIGVRPERSRRVAASYDPEAGRVTLLAYEQPAPGHVGYVNQAWKIQEHPFEGDVINSYNDGPLEGGGQMGPFYEIEASSPAYELAPGASMRHAQSVVHLYGKPSVLDPVTRALAGVGVETIRGALP